MEKEKFVGRPQKYDEETKVISFRIPLSKETIVRDLVNNCLIKLEK